MKRNTKRGWILSLLTGLFVLVMGACDGCACNGCACNGLGGNDCGGNRIESSFDGESSGGLGDSSFSSEGDPSQSDDDSVNGDSSKDEAGSSQDGEGSGDGEVTPEDSSQGSAEDGANSSKDEHSSQGGSSSEGDGEEHNFVLLKFDEAGHWYECVCGKRTDKEEHHYQCGKEIASCGDSKMYTIQYCDVCGYLAHESEVVLHPHDYVYIEPVLATCTKGGVSVWYQCATCGLDVLKIETAPLGHLPSNEETLSDDKERCCYYSVCLREGCGQSVGYPHEYVWELLEEPVCGEMVSAKGVCSLCQYETEQEFLAEHTFGKWERIKSPTCVEDGEEWRYCLVCGESEERTVEKTGHKWGIWLTTKKPNCKEGGEITRKCLVCGVIETESTPEAHSWGEWTVIKEPTCTENGERQRTCTLCGKVDNGIISARHLFDDGVVEKEATCTEKGEIVKTCIRCGEKSCEEMDALGHDWKVTQKPPTEEEPGYRIYICRRCGLQHIIYYPNGDGWHNLVYDYDEGEHWLKCMDCSYTEAKEMHAFTIIYEEKEVVFEGQLMYEFSVYRVCYECGYSKQIGHSIVHEHIWAERIPPTATCESGGLSEGLKCSVPGCDMVYVQPEEVGPLGHVLTEIAEKKPTCTQSGWYAYECCQRYDCDYTTYRERAALGHDYVDSICTRCGEINLEPEELEYALSDDETYYTVVGLGSYSGRKLVIPSTYNDLPVQAIGAQAFMGSEHLEEVTIPSSVILIESGAFINCQKLNRVVIGENVTVIEDRAFMCCYNLSDITIPNGVTEIGKQAFFACQSLINIVIPNNVEYINAATFRGCFNLKSIAIGDGVYSIENGAFRECNSLTEVAFPDNLQYIGEDAFYSCENLTKVTFGEDLFSIGYGAFCGTNLENVVISDNVSYIREYAFSYCKNLKSITIGANITSIKQYAFSHCESLTNIEVSERNSTYQSIDGNLYSEDGTVFMRYASGKTDTSFSIPNGITHIESYAFSDCMYLTNVVIPDSVTTICDYAFSECGSLVSIEGGRGIASIGEGGFYWCQNLISVPLFDNLTMIGNGAFSGCEKLQGVILPDGLVSIGNSAFSGCESLTKINIPRGLTSLGEEAFYSCSSLEHIVIPDNITAIGKGAFYDCDSLKSIAISEYVTFIGGYVLVHCNNLVNIEVSENNPAYKSINGNLYNKDATILMQYALGKTEDSFRIIDSVTTIGGLAFEGCTNLTSITIHKAVRTIEEYAFYGCKNLTNITFEGTVEEWDLIKKGEAWNIHIGTTEVVCCNGTVTI